MKSAQHGPPRRPAKRARLAEDYFRAQLAAETKDLECFADQFWTLLCYKWDGWNIEP